MTTEQMKRYVDICLEAYPDSITRLALSGGECFMLGSDLDEIVRYGASKGLSVDVISNGYWGKSYKSAYKLAPGAFSIRTQSVGPSPFVDCLIIELLPVVETEFNSFAFHQSYESGVLLQLLICWVAGQHIILNPD